MHPDKRAKRASLGRCSFARVLVGKKSILHADCQTLRLCPPCPFVRKLLYPIFAMASHWNGGSQAVSSCGAALAFERREVFRLQERSDLPEGLCPDQKQLSMRCRNAVAGGESASMRNLVMGSIQQSAEAEIHASPPSTPDVRTITNYITLPGYLRVAK